MTRGAAPKFFPQSTDLRRGIESNPRRLSGRDPAASATLARDERLEQHGAIRWSARRDRWGSGTAGLVAACTKVPKGEPGARETATKPTTGSSGAAAAG